MNYLGSDLNEIKDLYKNKWKLIKEKYPKADGQIYFAYKGEFASINDSFSILLKKNHYLFFESEAKKKALNAIKANKDTTEDELRKILAHAELNPDCRIEVLWNDLDYDLIEKMQNDILIDQELTPKSRASIKIVLGIVGTK